MKKIKYNHITNEAFWIICTKEDNHIFLASSIHLTQQMLQHTEVATYLQCIVKSDFLLKKTLKINTHGLMFLKFEESQTTYIKTHKLAS